MKRRRILPGLEINRLLASIRPGDLRRFMARIRLDGECWLWTGHRDDKGYGQFRFGDRAWWAHRWSYAVFVDSIPADMTVDHICRNTSCVCPSHLRVLTRAENTAIGNKNRATDAEYDGETF